jgi:hypothetical protein
VVWVGTVALSLVAVRTGPVAALIVATAGGGLFGVLAARGVDSRRVRIRRQSDA